MTQPPPQGQRQLRLEVPADLRAEYCNAVTIAQSANDVTLDFIHVLPGVNSARVQARVVMLPAQAKMLMRMLEQNIARHEERFGEIKLGPNSTLADELFGGVKPGSGEEPS
ncbi:MAG: DUF3467 domain-containing protein [Anaerolineae bacterium]|nr:DUF3467 domain-containing protein [Anaerolineae bacterium]